MARFRNTRTGVVISVDSEAPMLPGSWEPYDSAGETKKTAPRKRTSRKKADPAPAPDATSDATGDGVEPGSVDDE